MTPYYGPVDGVTLYLGDCREVLPSLPPASCLFTSPPYLKQRDYTGALSEPWHEVVPPAIRASRLTGNGQAFVNLGLVHREGAVVEYWRPLLDTMADAGMPLFGWYVWDQLSGLPGDWNGRLAPSFEFVFHFAVAPLTPHKTQRCASAGLTYRSSTMRKRDGTTQATGARTTGEKKILDSVIRLRRFVPVAAPNYLLEHPAQFPPAFPAEFVAAYTNPGETVLDPFAGTGATLVAAKHLGRQAVGIEISERYAEIAATRLSQRVLDLQPGSEAAS